VIVAFKIKKIIQSFEFEVNADQSGCNGHDMGIDHAEIKWPIGN
jgi:hypothetical protein